jgi:hypothetical protein
MPRYAALAALLGAGWFPVLLLPYLTREWLLKEPLRNILLLALASVIVALAFRHFIARASSLWSHFKRAILLPYLGCLVFLTLTAGVIWAEHFLYGNLADLHDTLSLYYMGFVSAVTGCGVVVPYGLVCQFVMNRAANEIEPETPERE